MSNKNCEELFLKQKPVRAILSLNGPGEHYALKLSHEIDSTYAHTTGILQKLDKHELVSFEQSGRKKIISLTPTGKEVANKLVELHNHLDNLETTA